jgi:predicted GH43/DUF377 family glycosyl hydrolase
MCHRFILCVLLILSANCGGSSGEKPVPDAGSSTDSNDAGTAIDLGTDPGALEDPGTTPDEGIETPDDDSGSVPDPGASDDVGVTPDSGGNIVLNFSKTNNSVISSGSVGEPMFLSDPGVIKDDSGYHIFTLNQYCDVDGDGVFEPGDGDFSLSMWNDCFEGSFNGSHRQSGATLYAFSADQGQTWQVRPTPVLEASKNGLDWDEEKIETPFPFQMGDTLYLFYSATGVHSQAGFLSSRYSVGVATLDLEGRSIKEALFDDSAVFNKHPANPILEYNATDSDYNNSLAEPSVVFRNGKFEVFVTGLRVPNPASDVGDSLNGMAFGRFVLDTDMAFESAEISNLLDLLEPDFNNAVLPLNIVEVHHTGEQYLAFYTFFGEGDFHEQETIKLATSPDGLNWSNDETILSYGDSITDSDGWGIMAPTVVLESEQAVLFYTGWGEVDEGPCDRDSPDAKWGVGVYANSKCVYGGVGRAVSNIVLE